MKETIRNSIKTLTRVYYDYQRERMALDGRLGQTKNGDVKKGAPERDTLMLAVIQKRRDDVFAFEEVTKMELAKEVHKDPLWKSFLKDIKGVGEGMAAVIISEFDIERWVNVSKGWQFAGMNSGMVRGRKPNSKKVPVVTDTLIQGDKKTKGFLCPCNMFLKKQMLGVLGPSFLKCHSPYEEIYRNLRHRYESDNWGIASKNPTDKTKPKAYHQHLSANRIMVKEFMKDLYVAWRTIEGLPVREPYSEEYLNKKHSA